MAYVNVCGKNIYYEEYGMGNKPTVIYMHGGPGESCLTYSYEAQKLGEYFHIISFDQYGVFRSDGISEEQKVDVKYHIDMIEQMRIELGVKNWIPLGHSFGGMLALVYAHTYQDSVDAVIYDCPMWSALHTARAIAQATLPYFEQNNVTEQVTLINEILKDEIPAKEAFYKSMNIEWNEELNRYCHVIEMSKYHSYINEYISEPKVEEDCWGKYIPFRQKLFDSEDFYYDYLPYLANIHKPQLLIVGEYDMTCGKFEQEWFNKYVPDGKTEILENSAHLSWIECPEKYTDLIIRFIGKNDIIFGLYKKLNK